MEKNYLDGVVPPAQKRSIRDIPVPPRNRRGNSSIKKVTHVKKDSEQESKSENIVPSTPAEEMPSQPRMITPPTRRRSSGGNKKYLITGVVAAVIVLLFIILSSFDSAVITLQPKEVESSVNKNLQIGDLSDSDTSYDLGYRTIELAKQADLQVGANNEEFVQQNASGIITVYNRYSNDNQNLIKNTRFESPDGLIYKIQESVSVPGYTGSGDSITPGTIDVEVVAAEPGEEYNTDSAEFTIPGFKDQEPYEFFSAKTKTAITGGFDGVRKIVSDENIGTASTELRQKVSDALIDELQQQVTDEFIAVYNADSFTYQNIEQEDAPNGEDVVLKLNGEIVAKVFNKVDLSNAVALNVVNEYTMDQDVLIENIEEITLSASIETETREREDADGEIEEFDVSIENLSVNGNMKFVWQNNIEKIKKDLAGINREEMGSVMKNYVGVSKAEAVIKPFWRSKLPTDPKNIKIEFVGNQ